MLSDEDREKVLDEWYSDKSGKTLNYLMCKAQEEQTRKDLVEQVRGMENPYKDTSSYWENVAAITFKQTKHGIIALLEEK